MDEQPDTTDAGLTGLTKAGLWYIYSSTPSFWATVARAFALRVEPSDWHEQALRTAESDAASAVRFVPVPLLVGVVAFLLSAWWRPVVGGFLTAVSDEGFAPLARSAPLMTLGHHGAESAAVVLIALAVWVLSLASVLIAFAPVWLAFRHQMRSAASVVSLALAAESGDPVATARDALRDYPRVHYALGKLRSGPPSTR